MTKYSKHLISANLLHAHELQILFYSSTNVKKNQSSKNIQIRLNKQKEIIKPQSHLLQSWYEICKEVITGTLCTPGIYWGIMGNAVVNCDEAYI